MPLRILVVDDERVILDLIHHALSVRGYEVVCTADPLQALATAAASHVDLILSDVVMPGMRGPELVRKVKEASPGIAALLMSGFAAGPDVPDDVPFISKPFKIEELVRCIGNMLKQTRAAGANGSCGNGN